MIDSIVLILQRSCAQGGANECWSTVVVKKIFIFSVLLLIVCKSSIATTVGNEITPSGIPFMVFPESPAAGEPNKINTFGWMRNGFALETAHTSVTFNSLFPVCGPISLNGGFLTLASDLKFENPTLFNSSGSIFGNHQILDLSSGITQYNASSKGDLLSNLTIMFHSDMTFSGQVLARGLCLIDGTDHILTLNTTADIVVDSNSTLTLRNLTLKNASSSNIRCSDNASHLIFDNVKFFDDAKISDEKKVVSPPAQISVVEPKAGLSKTMTSSTALKDLIDFETQQPSLMLSNTTMHITATGMTLIDGKMQFQGPIQIEIVPAGSRASKGVARGGVKDSAIEFESGVTLDEKRAYYRAQHRAQKHEQEERIGKWEYRYTHPSWPFPALPYKKKDLISLSGALDLASQGYTSGGNKQDISKIIFTDQPIKIQDILVVSKLVKAGLLNPTGGGVTTNHFLYFLADETISFDGSYEQYLGSFDYARRIGSTFSLGFQIPFVHRRNKLRMSANLSPAAQSKLNEGTGVTSFPATLDGYESFVIDILSRKGIGQHVKNSSTGLGNMVLFGSAHIKTHLADSLVLGIKAELPTTRDRDTAKLWDAQTGNEFTKLSAYFGLLYGKRPYLNPHIYVQGSYNMAASVDRRVARRRIYNGTSGGTSTVSAISDTVPSMQGVVYGDKVRYINNTAFDTPDATVTRFETDTGRVKIHPGPEFNFHIGNVFNRALSKRFEVDVYYDFRAKARDWVSSKLNPAVYDARTLTDRTYEVEHKVGLGVNCHVDTMFRVQGGGTYSFAGRNVAELFALYVALRIEF
jgi:hypothetical protein